MRASDFFRFATTSYRSRDGNPLQPKAARDVISRCGRVERALRIDLDDAVREGHLEDVLDRITEDATAFGFRGDASSAVRVHRSAVLLYARFAVPDLPVEEFRWSWYRGRKVRARGATAVSGGAGA
jgi:hypothetical protein